ncbi:MAG: glycosyltransferase family 4 protein [Candidatus Omnitrophica bacterium]|nr:glycosyltransferase family 4 protein [Candidatus Omnitrophota bacterium]
MDRHKIKNIGKIVVIGNYLPRKCGIATFTTDLSLALSKELKVEQDLINIAMDDIPKGHDYPSPVKFRVRQNVQSDYFWAADYVNANQYEAAILQHEYGIFGGDDGSYILDMIKSLKMPVITNLHTVLENPTDGQRKVMNGLAKYSDRLLIMSKKAFEILTRVYGIDREMICFVPHGIPDAPFEKHGLYNKQFALENRDIILTFGLLGPGKGIENMIEALPAIVKDHPNVSYLILGKTHPHVLDESGDSYRHGLQQLINKLKMQKHVVFHNHFVELATLVKYIQTSKIYAIPYLNKERITSGTLAYALGVGAAVVSTPFWHAEELLADGRGCLVPFNDPTEMSNAINELLSNDRKRESMRAKAYKYGRSMIWKEVARQHFDIISEINERKSLDNMEDVVWEYHKIFNELPEINLSHVRTLTDSTGIIQHAKYTTPNLHHGYCVDDNARALISTVMYYSLRKDKDVLPLLQTYLAFLYYAFKEETGKFRNFMTYDRRWLEEIGSEDSHARSLWSLGVTVKEAPNDSIRNIAMLLFKEGLPVMAPVTSPRAWAFAILGLQAYLSVYGGDTDACNMRNILADKIYTLFKNNATDEWPWCEEKVTYANAVLPHALIIAGERVPNKDMYEMGIKSLKWLLQIQTAPEGHLSLIGNNGWLDKQGNHSKFGQQPIEAMSLINSCLDVYSRTGEKFWLHESERCLSWFMGQNDLQTPVYDYKTGGCGDGIESYGVSANQGAESSLAWLISLIKMYTVVGIQ